MSDDFQWGAGTWGEIGWADSDEAFAHSLRTVVGINSQATARRLGATHVLTTLIEVDSDAVSIGYGPRAIHPLSTSVAIETEAESGPLTFAHFLATDIEIDGQVAPALLTFGHTLATDITIASASGGYLTLRHHLATLIAIDTPAGASHLTLSHPLATIVEILTAADAAEILTIPIILPPDLLDPERPDSLVPGILNLVRNPSAELSIEGWTPFGDASLETDDDHAWHGDHAVRVTVPTADLGQGVAIRTAMALRLLPWGGSVLWGRAHVATPDDSVALAAWLRVHYTDGTTVDDVTGTGVAVTGTGETVEDWQLITTPPFFLAAGKRISYAQLMVEAIFSATVPMSFLIDGVQIELDEWMLGPGVVTVADVDPSASEAVA